MEGPSRDGITPSPRIGHCAGVQARTKFAECRRETDQIRGKLSALAVLLALLRPQLFKGANRRSMNHFRRQIKIGPRFRRGPSCLGSLVLRELGWRPYGGVAVGAVYCLGGRGYGCCRSAPFKEAVPWGDAASWAAKLFSIKSTCTLLWRTRPLSSAPWALPSATACMR